MGSWLSALPVANAALNTLSAALLLGGFYQIRRARVRRHRRCMLGACLASLLFLASYLTYHAYHGTTRLAAPPAVRSVYLGVLLSHTLLAAGVVPLVAVSLYRACRRQFRRHRRVARLTLPLWLYVSLTGVLIYVVLYQLYPQSPGK